MTSPNDRLSEGLPEEEPAASGGGDTAGGASEAAPSRATAANDDETHGYRKKGRGGLGDIALIVAGVMLLLVLIGLAVAVLWYAGEPTRPHPHPEPDYSPRRSVGGVLLGDEVEAEEIEVGTFKAKQLKARRLELRLDPSSECIGLKSESIDLSSEVIESLSPGEDTSTRSDALSEQAT